jgi:hypothetical protein
MIGLAVMISMIVLLVPGTLWMMGMWPAWILLSYFITIPTISGVFAAWLD